MSHLGVMVAVSAVLGLLVAGLAIPFVGALGGASKSAAGGLRTSRRSCGPSRWPSAPGCSSSGGKPIATFYDENRGQRAADGVAPIMKQRDHRDRGLPLLRARRARPEGHAAGLRQQPDRRRRHPGWLLDHPADGEDDPAGPGATEAERKAATENTYQRKIQELRHAIAFEQNYSKDWILERYLNLAYFGDGAYGIQAAARHYFAVNAKRARHACRRPRSPGW